MPKIRIVSNHHHPSTLTYWKICQPFAKIVIDIESTFCYWYCCCFSMAVIAWNAVIVVMKETSYYGSWHWSLNKYACRSLSTNYPILYSPPHQVHKAFGLTLTSDFNLSKVWKDACTPTPINFNNKGEEREDLFSCVSCSGATNLTP